MIEFQARKNQWRRVAVDVLNLLHVPREDTRPVDFNLIDLTQGRGYLLWALDIPSYNFKLQLPFKKNILI